MNSSRQSCWTPRTSVNRCNICIWLTTTSANCQFNWTIWRIWECWTLKTTKLGNCNIDRAAPQMMMSQVEVSTCALLEDWRTWRSCTWARIGSKICPRSFRISRRWRSLGLIGSVTSLSRWPCPRSLRIIKSLRSWEVHLNFRESWRRINTWRFGNLLKDLHQMESTILMVAKIWKKMGEQPYI